ncbi:MAG: 2-polyprenylphenol 6-hydroxylase [Rhodospirillaceae bacterium]
MIRSFRNFTRLIGISRTLARHDALFLLDGYAIGRAVASAVRLTAKPDPKLKTLRPGQRLAAALTSLGPTFIKLGQTLSTRPDLLGQSVTDDLTGLQDRLPPFAFADVKRTLAADFDGGMDALFESIEPEPVAAASIAQVHFATTTTGDEVAVKILRPGIREAFHRDLDLLYWLAETVESTQPRLRRLKPVETVRAFEQAVHIEMDLRFEAAAAEELRENFVDAPQFRVPKIDWQRTSEHVLTLERVSGVRVDQPRDVEALGLDPVDLVKTSAEVFFSMVFHHGFFHADMHPGNLFVSDDGTLIAIDFGIMGRIDAPTRRRLGEMLLGFLTRDYTRVAEVHIEAGYVPASKDVGAFAQACRSIAEPILGKPLSEISLARLLGQLFQITETFDMETQPQLLLLQKSMLLAEGVGRVLAPNVNMWELARPLIEDWMVKELGPQGKLRDVVSDTTATLAKLPRLIDSVDAAAAQIRRQGLKLDPETAAAIRGRAPGRSRIHWWPWAIAAVAVLLWISG